MITKLTYFKWIHKYIYLLLAKLFAKGFAISKYTYYIYIYIYISFLFFNNKTCII